MIHFKVSCLLTPTSLGFRNALEAEGIEFTMPLQKSNLAQKGTLFDTKRKCKCHLKYSNENA